MNNPKLYNLELHKKVNGKWVHQSTIIWNSQAPLCYGEKKKLDSVKAYFEFYKVVPNELEK